MGVARAAHPARPLIEARRHTLSIELPPQPVHVEADRTRLSQIMQNLLVNAAKYTPDGGRVAVKAQSDDGFVTISVTDNGRGIPHGDLQRIFELFAQGEVGSPNDSGLGVGLTLARSLAEMHGGRLDAESPGPGQGSTFLLRLPLGQRQQLHDPGRTAAFKVLVVDDNRDSADSACAIIRMLGYDAECAYDGTSALAAAARWQPQMVLLDLAMPGLDGYNTLGRLRTLPGMDRAHIVAMTGYGSQEDRRRTANAGFDGHLTKPVELDALTGLIDSVRQGIDESATARVLGEPPPQPRS